jgi:flagellum-specific peptidoglycan hydrolase FlgJ
MLTTNKVFAPAMAYRNEPVKFIDQLGRYATDPLYKKKLHDMLKTGNLLQYDAEVK